MYIMFQPLAKYALFSGRACRKEFWLFILLLVACNVIISNLFSETFIPWPTLGLILVTTIPQFAVTVRRLHDTNRRGWWAIVWCLTPYYFIGMNLFSTSPDSFSTHEASPLSANEVILPSLIEISPSLYTSVLRKLWAPLLTVFATVIYFIVLLCLKGTLGNNRFGPDPLSKNTSS